MGGGRLRQQPRAASLKDGEGGIHCRGNHLAVWFQVLFRYLLLTPYHLAKKLISTVQWKEGMTLLSSLILRSTLATLIGKYNKA